MNRSELLKAASLLPSKSIRTSSRFWPCGIGTNKPKKRTSPTRARFLDYQPDYWRRWGHGKFEVNAM